MIDPEAEKLINDIRISIQDAHSIMKVSECNKILERCGGGHIGKLEKYA